MALSSTFRMADRLDIESTAAAGLSSPTDSANCFGLIKKVVNIFGVVCEQKLRNNSKNDFYSVTFINLPSPVSIRTLEHVVKHNPFLVRNLFVHFPDQSKNAAYFQLEIELYRSNVPSVPPQFEYKHHRDTQFLKLLQTYEKKMSASEFPPGWKDDKKLLDRVTKVVYNMEDAQHMPLLHTSLEVTETAYVLTYNNMEHLSYAFVEYLMEHFHAQIEDVTVQSSGFATRELCVAVRPTTSKIATAPFAKRCSSKADDAEQPNQKRRKIQ
jgi:hypothetical protein